MIHMLGTLEQRSNPLCAGVDPRSKVQSTAIWTGGSALRKGICLNCYCFNSVWRFLHKRWSPF